MKKICYVVTIPLTIRAFFIPQLKYLADNGFDVTVICSNDDNLQKELGHDIHYLPIDIPRGISLKGSISTIRQLIKVFKKEKFDLVQYSTPNAAFYSSIAAKVAEVRIRNYHLMGYRYLGGKGVGRIILKFIEKVTCMLSTHIECVSKSNLELGISENLFKRNKATVVWNGSTGGVDTTRFDYSRREEWRCEVRKELGISVDDFLFGFVGRITRDKGINEILEAFREMQTDSKLLLLGSPEGIDTIEPKLWKEAQQNPSIYIHDSVSDVERYYAAIDVLLLPSYREGFGNVVIEAAAMGTPSIVSNIPGPIDAVIPGETAKVIATKRFSQLKNAMFEISYAESVKMGNQAARYVNSHFNSMILNEFIMRRKNELLKNIK